VTETARPPPSPLAAEFSLDPQVLYLNHGAFGACPRPVQRTQQALRERLEHNPIHFFMRELENLLDATRAALGPFVGADAEDLVFVPNATAGVNTVLAGFEFRAGAEVLLTNHGYPACRNAASHWAGRRGATLRIAEIPFPLRDAEQITEAVLASVNERTQLALLDHVTSPTGLVFPIEELVEKLAERGIPTLVDGAHAPGMLPLDLNQLGAAYYTGNLHKWCCAPKGAAFLWVRRDLKPTVHPLVISHGHSSPRTDRAKFQLEFDWAGSQDPSAVLSVPSALYFLEGLLPGGIRALQTRNHELALTARRLLCEALGTAPVCPDSVLGSLAVVLFPEPTPRTPSPEPLYQALVARGIEVPIVPWPGRPSGFVRIAAQAYNTLPQFGVLAEALRAELGLA